MNRLTIVLIVPLLAGCYTDREKHLASCELASTKFSYEHKNVSARDQISMESDLNEACMRAHGYRLAYDPRCPKPTLPNTGDGDRDLFALSADLWTKSKDPVCYEPMAWGERQTQAFETLFR